MTEKVKIGTKEFRIVHNDDGTKDVSLKGKCGNKLATETGHFLANYQPVTDAFFCYSKLLHNSDFFTLSPHFHYLSQPIKDNGSKYQQPQQSSTHHKNKNSRNQLDYRSLSIIK